MSTLLKKSDTNKFWMDNYNFKPSHTNLENIVYNGLIDEMPEEILTMITRKFDEGGYFVGDSSFPDTYQHAIEAIKSVSDNKPWAVVYMTDLNVTPITPISSNNPNLSVLAKSINAVRDENDYCTPKQIFDELVKNGFTITKIGDVSDNAWNDEKVKNMMWDVRYFWSTRHNAHIEFDEVKKQFDEYFERSKKALE